MNVFNSGAYSRRNSFLVDPIPRYCIKSIMFVSLFRCNNIINFSCDGSQFNILFGPMRDCQSHQLL